MLFCLLTLASQAGPSGDWVIPTGRVVYYDTSHGPAHVKNLIIEPGGYLRLLGPRPFIVFAAQRIEIDGTLDARGFDGQKVIGQLYTTPFPETGAIGGPGGGKGGTGSPRFGSSDPKGGDGFAVHLSGGVTPRGGRGGESAFGTATDSQLRRGAGGGGGAFGPDVAGGGAGLVATAGGDGHPLGKGALSGGAAPAQGGSPSSGAFHDADPTNDFWGRKIDVVTGFVTVGELALPRGGAGGGAGGDSIKGDVVPAPLTGNDHKGAGAGGGGGLVALLATEISVGASGSIRADGGKGAGAQTVFGPAGGSSGGGSGGMLVLQAEVIDLQSASANAITALGGIGGPDDGDFYPAASLSGGGNGGPGLIQLHVRNSAVDVLLPLGVGLADLTSPDAHVLLPEL